MLKAESKQSQQSLKSLVNSIKGRSLRNDLSLVAPNPSMTVGESEFGKIEIQKSYSRLRALKHIENSALEQKTFGFE